jgi:hypothetical protein
MIGNTSTSFLGLGSWLFEVGFDVLDGLPDVGEAFLVHRHGEAVSGFQSDAEPVEGGVDVFLTGSVTDVTFRVLVDSSGLRVLLWGHDPTLQGVVVRGNLTGIRAGLHL